MKARKILKIIPTFNLSNKKQIIIGVLLIIPLFFIPWFLSIPVGVPKIMKKYGREMGIRDEALLESALAQPIIPFPF